MLFTRSSRKPTEKESSDSAVLSFDLFSNLTYMSAVSTGDAPRDVILELAITQSYRTTLYFRQVYMLTKRLGFEYARSFQLVSQRARAESMKSLLLRFAASISTGISEHEFLSQEAAVERNQYSNMYQRSVETLQKWADAYAAGLVSVALIVVVVMISTMLYDLGDAFVFMITATMLVMSIVGVFVIYKTSPYEIMAYKRYKGPKERQRAVFLLLLFFPAGILMAILLWATMGMGMAFLALGFSLVPGGLYSYMDNTKVTLIDEELDKFIRSLGNVAESLGTTLTGAMMRVDRRSLRTLEPYVRRLQSRLRSRITPKVCWDRFVDETGSELVNRSTQMFVDGTTLGGSPAEVGRVASDFALTVSLLRARRHVTALPFAYLTIPLHGAMVALLVFVMEIMKTFNNKLLEATVELQSQSGAAALSIPNLPAFQPKDMGQSTMLTLGAVVVLTITNTLAPKFATGGHNLQLAFYGSIMCIVSGVSLVLIPNIAGRLLQ